LVKLASSNHDDDCSDVAEDDQTRWIPVELENIELGIEESGPLISILTALQAIPLADIDSVSTVPRTLTGLIGIYDWNRFLGMNIANTLVNGVMDIPKGVRFPEMKVQFEHDIKEWFCDNTEPRRDCERYEECNYRQECDKQNYSDKVSCEVDECNNCKARHYYSNDTSRDYQCLKCEFPKQIENGEMSRRSGENYAQYKCNDAFAMRNCDDWAYCNNGNLSLPVCEEAKFCSFNTTIDNGQLNETDNSPCGWARYSCNDGYWASSYSTDTTVRCKNGEIQGEAKCEKADCYFPDQIDNGYKRYGYRDNAYYTCTGRHQLKDCQSAASCYSGVRKLPVCEEYCDFTEYLENGKMYQPYEGQCYGGYGYQYRTYACDDGFDLADDTSSYVTCRNGYVDNSRFPVCVSRNDNHTNCYFPDIDNGFKENVYEHDNRSHVKYTCYDGFTLDDEHTGIASCNNGTVINMPKCVKDNNNATCAFPTIDYGRVVDEGQVDNVTWAKYECYSGYTFTNSSHNGYAVCMNGTVYNVPKCGTQQEKCTFPPIDNGYIKEAGEKDGYQWARYMCNKGFELAKTTTNGIAVCKNGTITMLPVCQQSEPTCSFPDIKNGKKIWSGFNNGRWWAKYQCNKGYTYQGDNDGAYCEGDKAMDVPQCVYLPCKWKNIDNGEIVERGMGWARYECADGYEFVNGSDFGNEYAMCEDGKVVQTPACKKEDTTDCNFPKIKNGTLIQQGRKGAVVWALYQCNDGFELAENTTNIAYCMDGKIKKDGFPRCEEKNGDDDDDDDDDDNWDGKCKLPKEIENGGVIAGSWNATEMTAKYYCNKDSKMYETSQGAYGFCKFNMAIVPICVKSDDYLEISFKLDGGKTNNTGNVIVFAKKGGDKIARPGSAPSATEMGPYTICDDGLSYDAANVVCKQMGYSGGRKVYQKKITKLSFGVTNVQCRDIGEGLMHSCRWEDYGEEGAMACTSKEQVAVNCYKGEKYSVTTMVAGVVKKKTTSLMCGGKATKEGVQINFKDIVKPTGVSFYGIQADGTAVDMKDTLKKVTCSKNGCKSKSSSKVKYQCFKCCMSFADNTFIDPEDVAERCVDNCT